MKYHNLENLLFQHFTVKEKILNKYENNRLEEINRRRNDIRLDTLTSDDVVQIIKCGGVISEVFEGFFCQNLEYNPYKKLVTDVFGKRNLFKSQVKDLLQNQAKMIGLSVYGDTIGNDIYEEYKLVTET